MHQIAFKTQAFDRKEHPNPPTPLTVDSPSRDMPPVHKVPVEILNMIFHEAMTGTQSPVADDYDDDKFPEDLESLVDESGDIPKTALYSFPLLHDYRTMYRISGVCKFWRTIISKDTRLWASLIDLDRYSLSMIRHIVERRTKSSKLMIRSFSGYTPTRRIVHNLRSDTWTYAFHNMQRWGAFSLQTDLSKNRTWQSLRPHLAQPAPQLEAFTLINQYDPCEASRAMRAFFLPQALFRVPRHLKIFIIKNVYFPPEFCFPSWMNLRVLKVFQDTRYHYGVQISALNWLVMCRNMRQLEHLEIHGFGEFGEVSTTDLAKNEDVHLSHLSHLILEASKDRAVVFDLFSKLIVPPTCQISIRIASPKNSEYPPSAFDRLKIGIDRLCESVRRHSDAHPSVIEPLTLILNNFVRHGQNFVASINTRYARDANSPMSSHYSIENFKFVHIPEYQDDDADNDVTPMPINPLGLDAIPSASNPNHPFALLLASLETVSTPHLYIQNWPRIVAEEVGPLCRLLSHCEETHQMICQNTDPVILQIITHKRNVLDETSILLPSMTNFILDTKSDVVSELLLDFYAWRESMGKIFI